MTDRPSAVLFGSLAELAREHGERIALDRGAEEVTFAELLADARDLASRMSGLSHRRIAVTMPASRAWIAAVAALDAVGASTYLVHAATDKRRLEELATTFELDGVLRLDGTTVRIEELRLPSAAFADAGVTLLTSGTTGAPKGVQHDWPSLRRPVRIDPRFVGTRWLLTNPPHLYAGLQVFLQCFLNAGTLVALPDGLAPHEIGDAMLDAGVEFVSATPSFWRRLLRFGSVERLQRLALRQITLGGEAAPAELLHDLRRIFPAAHLSHIYATSELGRCFTVTDGLEGFPARFLHDCPEAGVSLRVVDGELQARSPNRMRHYAHGSGPQVDTGAWIATGDVVEVVGDRVLFRGRRTDMINVGGNKVHSGEVELVLRQVEGIVEARVYPMRSSIVGEMVAADVVAAPGRDPEILRRELAQHCARVLQPHQRPRRVSFVSELALTSAGKVSRQGPSA